MPKAQYDRPKPCPRCGKPIKKGTEYFRNIRYAIKKLGEVATPGLARGRLAEDVHEACR